MCGRNGPLMRKIFPGARTSSHDTGPHHSSDSQSRRAATRSRKIKTCPGDKEENRNRTFPMVTLKFNDSTKGPGCPACSRPTPYLPIPWTRMGRNVANRDGLEPFSSSTGAAPFPSFYATRRTSPQREIPALKVILLPLLTAFLESIHDENSRG
jgi:hypothetical protein